MKSTKPHSVNLFISCSLSLLIIGVAFSCNPKTEIKTNDVKGSTTNPPPDCPPNKITEFYKLELMKADYDALKLKASAGGNAGGLTFQFAYIPAAAKRLTLVAYAGKPGRDFQPPSLKYLTVLNSSPVALPDTISLGDQKVLFGGPKGFEQLINASPYGANFYSITFTPDVIQTSYTPLGGGASIYVKNIKYKICLKYETSPGVFTEYCGAAPIETQPSPPANYQ